MAKFEERIKARELRRNGESIRIIADKLGVSKSTVSLWCGDIELSEEQRKKLIEDDRRGGAVGRVMAAISVKKERLRRMDKYMGKGKILVGHMGIRDLFIAGIALYWAEGNKKNRRVIFSNSDPMMIKIWIRWLTECLSIPKNDICCQVGINQLHKYRLRRVEKYWSKITGISLGMFRRASLKKVIAAKVYDNPESHFGTLNLRVLKSTNLNYLILGLIEGLGSIEAKS